MAAEGGEEAGDCGGGWLAGVDVAGGGVCE